MPSFQQNIFQPTGASQVGHSSPNHFHSYRCSSAGYYGLKSQLSMAWTTGLVCSKRPNGRASTHVIAFSDWSYGAYQSSTDWNTRAGGYPGPRQTGTQPQGQPSREPVLADEATTSYKEGMQESDLVSDVARTVVDAVGGFLGFLVGRLSDAALGLLPPHVKRRAVENSVKGGLALLGLALLQSVLTLVLTAGTLVLAIYTANQVFGLQLPFLPGASAADMGVRGGSAASGYSNADPRYFTDSGYGAYGRGPAQPPPRYYRPEYGYRVQYDSRGRPQYPPRYGGRMGPSGRYGTRGSQQGPTIDVYSENDG